MLLTPYARPVKVNTEHYNKLVNSLVAKRIFTLMASVPSCEPVMQAIHFTCCLPKLPLADWSVHVESLKVQQM